MRKTKVTKANLDVTVNRLQNKYAQQIFSKLDRMSTAELDKIPVIKVGKEHFDVVNTYAIVFDIPYPNEREFIPIYLIGTVPYRFII